MLELLESMLDGKRDFDGMHSITDSAALEKIVDVLYPDTHFNYFANVSTKANDFVLCLHPDVKGVAEIRGNPELMKYLWFGAQRDPVSRLTAAMVSKLLDEQKGCDKGDADVGELSDVTAVTRLLQEQRRRLGEDKGDGNERKESPFTNNIGIINAIKGTGAWEIPIPKDDDEHEDDVGVIAQRLKRNVALLADKWSERVIDRYDGVTQKWITVWTPGKRKLHTEWFDVSRFIHCGVPMSVKARFRPCDSCLELTSPIGGHAAYTVKLTDVLLHPAGEACGV